MNKKLAEKIKSRKHCEICGRPGEQIHHIFFGNGKRIRTEREECLAYLCRTCHHEGVHKYRELDLIFKRKAQRRLFKEYTLEEVREIVGGKIY